MESEIRVKFGKKKRIRKKIRGKRKGKAKENEKKEQKRKRGIFQKNRDRKIISGTRSRDIKMEKQLNKCERQEHQRRQLVQRRL